MAAVVLLAGVPGTTLLLESMPPGSAGATAAASTDPVLAVAGDMVCDIGAITTATECQQSAVASTARALNADAVLPLGDEQYMSGSAAAFSQQYDPTWGQLKSLSRPVPGNHEYQSTGATPYFNYFGPSAGDPSSGGYYSYDLGAWHLIALNSECYAAPQAGCAAGSAQESG